MNRYKHKSINQVHFLQQVDRQQQSLLQEQASFKSMTEEYIKDIAHSRVSTVAMTKIFQNSNVKNIHTVDFSIETTMEVY